MFPWDCFYPEVLVHHPYLDWLKGRIKEIFFCFADSFQLVAGLCRTQYVLWTSNGLDGGKFFDWGNKTFSSINIFFSYHNASQTAKFRKFPRQRACLDVVNTCEICCQQGRVKNFKLFGCRNCLLGKGYTVKICDWALLRSTYTACYYRTQAEEALPLRWMAWEAFLMVSTLHGM